MNNQKYASELSYWAKRYVDEDKLFSNAHYKDIFLNMSQQISDDFISNKIIADFGCGPRGSLAWAKKANLRFGIDILADAYLELFHNNIENHNTIYVKCTENYIPIPSNFFDIVFTLNALDHVDNLSQVSSEIERILKPGGELIGSFNIGEPPTPSEPQTLSESIIYSTVLSDKYDITSWRTAQKSERGTYDNFKKPQEIFDKGSPYILWVRATKKYDPKY